MNAGRGLRGAWILLLVGCAVLVSCADALLLEVGQTFFTAGFNAVYIQGAGALGAFALASLSTDLCLIAGAWAIGIHVVRRRAGTALQKLAALSLASIALPFSVDFVHYQLGLVLGRTVSLPILFEVSGGGFRLMLAEAFEQGGPLLVVLALAGLASAGVVWLVGRIEKAHPGAGDARLPDPRRLGVSFAALLVVSCAGLVGSARALPRVHEGLAAKPSAWMLVRLIQLVTDVDRDGSGMLSHPVDPAPFDSSRHPFAIDEAGNGIDENGLAGDLPAGWRAPEIVALEPVPRVAARRPDFLLVYLESFRADRVGRARNGREITPFLNQLAREGSSSQHAYVHSPYTIWSRAQLFGGRLNPRYGQDTLVDDFHAQGYTVAHFSGQDDSFGRSIELLGLDRVDHFYDARDDIESRTSRSTNAGSLQVSAKLLVRRVEEYLDAYSAAESAAESGAESAAEPLFLYVNFVDTHFPYAHEDVDDLLGVSPISRYEISVRNAEAVRATYDNTTANVDRAIRDLVERFRDAIGGRDHAILVASDHGQALFENDFLGHGQALTDDQTRTPLILFGIGGDWPEPLGMADLRGMLQRNLFAARGEETPRARFVPDPGRRVFHFMAQIRRPHLIGLRSLDGLASFAFDRDALELYDASGARRDVSPRDEIRELEDVVRAWETIRLQSADEAEVREAPGPA